MNVTMSVQTSAALLAAAWRRLSVSCWLALLFPMWMSAKAAGGAIRAMVGRLCC